MISEELKNIVEKLQEKGKTAFLEGATEEQIESFEKANAIKFPSKYREWLLFSDGGECYLPAGVQFYGVAHKPFLIAGNDNRPNDSYIVIGALASGDPVLCEKAGEKISVYDNETGTIDDELVYDDYFAFLNGLYDLLGIGE